MIKTIRELLVSKQKLVKMQEEFEEKSKITYPSLLTEDLEKLKTKIESELWILLSSSLKCKSHRIELNYSNSPSYASYKKLVLTRNPGLKTPYSSYSEISLEKLKEITSNGTLIMSKPYCDRNKKGKNPQVNIGYLKTHKFCKPDRIEMFLTKLKEYLGLNFRSKKFIDRHGNGEPRVQPGHFRVIVYQKPEFRLMFKEKPKKKDEDTESYTWDSDEMVNFDDYNIPIEIQSKFVQEFETLHKILLKLNQEKAEASISLNKFLEELKKENQAFKILEKLVS